MGKLLEQVFFLQYPEKQFFFCFGQAMEILLAIGGNKISELLTGCYFKDYNSAEFFV
jgi:hypothetical protein